METFYIYYVVQTNERHQRNIYYVVYTNKNIKKYHDIEDGILVEFLSKSMSSKSYHCKSVIENMAWM